MVFGDVIIGALYAGPSDSGAAYVIFGQADGLASSLDLSTLDGTNGFRLHGAAPGDLTGVSVSGAGDVNGDGFEDLIIGAYAADQNGYDSGAAYVVFGRTDGFAPTVDLSGLDGTNGFRLDGAAELDEVGQSVSEAGDVNGDGFDDVIVSTSHGDIDATGVAYVVFGQPGNFAANLDLSTLDGTDGFRLDGYAGIVDGDYSVSGVGDLNGDGYDDLIVGDNLATRTRSWFSATPAPSPRRSNCRRSTAAMGFRSAVSTRPPRFPRLET